MNVLMTDCLCTQCYKHLFKFRQMQYVYPTYFHTHINIGNMIIIMLHNIPIPVLVEQCRSVRFCVLKYISLTIILRVNEI